MSSKKPSVDRPERLNPDLEGLDPATLAIRAGSERTLQGEHRDAIFATSSFLFSSAREAAARFAGDEPGNIYSRFTNPTVRAFEGRVAAMEGAERAVATASGMAAILSTCMALCQAGDHIVCSRSVFGTTTVLLDKYLSRFGVETTFVEQGDIAAWKAAMRDTTRLLYLESPSNPLCRMTDIRALAEISREHDALLIVDNVFWTSALQRPIDLGADIVLHSATKYMDGQGRCIGGVVCGKEAVMEEIFGFLRSAGTTLSPFNAWVIQSGLETLDVRMRAHSDHAMQVARWLEEQPEIETVFYPGLASHPDHELARSQLREDLPEPLFGGVLSFRVSGGQDEAWKVIDSTRVISITANLGDVRTTITHPATTTHGRLSPEDKDRAGITPNLIRVAVGLESIDDIREELRRGLDAIA